MGKDNSKQFDKEKLTEFLLKYALYFILGLILIVSIIIEPGILSLTNFINILKQASTKGILALGVAGIIVLAGTDLSVGRILGLCAALSASLLQSVTYASRYYPNITKPIPLIVPLLLSIFIAVAVSAFNGFAVAKLHLHAFIATLGTQLIAYGCTCIYIENQPSGSTQALSTLDARFTNLATGSIDLGFFKLPYLVIIFAACAVFMWVIWNKTVLGKNMFAVGGNSEAAEVSGVNVTKTIIGVFMMAGLMYGIGSFLEAARIQSVGPNAGFNYELDAISAVVIGGVSFNGGVGSISGVILGTIILQAINYCLYFMGVNAYLQYIIRGALIIIAVSIDVRKYLAKK